MTICLLSSKPTFKGRLILGVMKKIVDKICSSFVRVQKEIENEEKTKRTGKTNYKQRRKNPKSLV